MHDGAMGRQEEADRRAWMSLLARAPLDELERLWSSLPATPRWSFLRPPETGAVTVRGRAGGTGRRFNLGEMTVTRCAVRLDEGGVGLAYVAAKHAELAAALDALLQDPARRDEVEMKVIAPLAALLACKAELASRRAAATKVEFFTLVRGDA
jgi:alpha-D-ribose 1-methylphosphonate 5-triphosphate synthase subunit PhnG